jgi:hypothetical protein
VAAGKQALQEYFTGREHPSVATGQEISFGMGVDATPVQNSIDRIATKLLR